MSLTVDWKHPSTKRIILSYLPDWILVILMAIAFYCIDLITPFRRRFSLEDKTIMFPHSPEDSVRMWVVGIICFLAPILIIAVLGLGYKRSVIDFHSGVLGNIKISVSWTRKSLCDSSFIGLCLSLSMCVMLTTVIKITVGRPRPDFIDRCQPSPGAVDPVLGLSDYTICTTPADSHLMIDGFKSFPSGHSSFSFAGLSYLAFYIAGKIQMFDERGHTYKGFLFAFPIIGALLVAISRTSDYRHHWQDVFVGSLLGIACAYFSYRQYYPVLGHSTSHKPFKTRIEAFKSNYIYNSSTVNDGPPQHSGDRDQLLGVTVVTDDPANCMSANSNSYPLRNADRYPH
ncbi:phosphatidic acid phosphatase type 2/haloperoxidase [Dichotomocladium elegans]|nr:phosphatidic acid phosphatase type 2/haloperoxidase [Dichotomocladium elegans]